MPYSNNIFTTLLILFSFSAHAQQSSLYTDVNSAYKRGLELFEKQKYGAAQKAFSETIEAIRNPSSQVSMDAQYFAALCGLELFHKDAEQLLIEFIEEHPENPRVRTAYFQLGRFHFRKKEYSDVIFWFSKVDIYDLTNEELAEYYFKLGYSYFIKQEYDKAQTVFFEIKEINSSFSKPALYYYSHIQYRNGNYETALDGFLKLADSSSFTAIVPYYITQIYYLEQKYDKLLEYAPPILDTTTTTRRAAEIAHLIGDAYFQKGNYDAAVPYLERFQRESQKLTREDQYQLGYAYYKSGNYNSAIETFKLVTKVRDILAQNSFYHMAACYLEKGKKDFARHTFRAAALLNADQKIQEDALFSYAKLSFELDLSSIQALENYTRSYPNTPRADEAYSYLAEIYLRTKNYKNALASLEGIKNLNVKLKTAFQKIAFSRGIELFNDRKYAEAIAHFEKSLTYPSEKTTELLAYYWKGEAWYRLNRLDNAIAAYQQFIFLPGAFDLGVFNQVYYNLGYCFFDKKDYAASSTWFRKFTRNTPPADIVRKGDAWVRIADCFFAQSDFSNAIDYYDSAITYRTMDTDYSLFQKSLALGVTGHKNEKVQTLLTLINQYKGSAYLDDAKYEIGISYLDLGQSPEAMLWFESILKDHANSRLVKKAMLRTGLIQFNDNQYDLALETFKKVITLYPATDESIEALAGCKNIFIQSGKIDEYAALVQNIPFANVTRASLDSATYEAAELRYQKGNCAGAIGDFEKYIQKFPDGFFVRNAGFYKAECEYKSGNVERALAGYLDVISQTESKFTEKSLLQLSRIYFSKDEVANALIYYSRLEQTAELPANLLHAYVGQLRCHSKLNNHDMAINYADKIIGFEKAGADIRYEAHLLKAKAAMAFDNYNLAFNEVTLIANVNSEMGAEAKYIAAYIQYLRGNYKQCEEIVFQLSNQVPSYDNWVAKGFILLADNYVMMNNLFQARATLQSVIDNYEGAELTEIAKSKLDKIIMTEQSALQQKKETKEEEILFEQQDIDYDKLFEEEKINE